MTGRELVEIIQNNNLLDCNIVIGCQGYTTNDCPDEDEIRVLAKDGNLYITDVCYIPGVTE